MSNDTLPPHIRAAVDAALKHDKKAIFATLYPVARGKECTAAHPCPPMDKVIRHGLLNSAKLPLGSDGCGRVAIAVMLNPIGDTPLMPALTYCPFCGVRLTDLADYVKFDEGECVV